ncbi:MAG: VOC family protein [Cryobacterium sp.]|uniref:VOC family protein n=1 Tax=unclassified Cryobacterium TaxID=2649013 RepID=UPI0018C96A64|nr:MULTISPECIES: VOC family protein [unclassified Cryobacterium]MCY7404079.1 VOC family protein [Cryobacterium sp.]MEC5153206.1 catechol 2,3-dioxygenase-like lactoylglutathione lyase family enzyme [Cryobacterium sp. CAN_C3]
MFSQLETYSVLPARDLARARRFYKDVLGMEPDEERVEGLLYRTPKGAAIMVYETDNAGTAANTAIAFVTDDIDAEVAALRGRGVTFQEYDFPGLKTEDGIATMNEERAAWFKDTEGNIICVSQTPASDRRPMREREESQSAH